MQLKLQSFFAARPFNLSEPRPANAEISWQEHLVTVAAVSLGVLAVASIAVLMGLLN